MSENSAQLLPGNDAQNDLNFTARITSITLLSSLIMSWPLYVPGFRIFSTVPLLDFLTAVPAFIDVTIFIAAISSLVILCIYPEKRFLAAIALGCEVFWILQDFIRLQPYNYMYCFALFCIVFPTSNKVKIDALRIMVSGVYFWAGFHKLNVSFFYSVFPWFVQPVHDFLAPQPHGFLEAFFRITAVITPVFESLIGVLLLFPRWRIFGTAMAFSMLMTVLVCLGPLGHAWGMIVWPWNVFLFLLEFQLFLNSSSRINPLPFFKWGQLGWISFILFVPAPSLAIITPWYSFPGFKLYSGNIISAKIRLAPEETLAKAPDFIKQIAKANKDIDMMFGPGWEIDTSLPPVPYVFKTTGAGLCPYLDYPDKTILQINFPPPFYSRKITSEDSPLCP